MEEELAVLEAADYAVFSVMLALSALIGLYFAYKGRKEEGIRGYLLAERQMSFIPVAVSISLTLVSAVTILGIPAEIHFYGPVYIWFLVGTIVWVTPVVAEIFLPLFYRLQICSQFEYIEMRFDKFLRLLCTFIYIVQNVMYIGVMIYAPALALSSVTNFELWVAITSVGVVCTIYTTLGGLKAVIWTDVFQGVLLIAVVIVIVIMGSREAGGFSKVWEACGRGDRLDFFHFELDPRIRLTFWTMFIGFGFLWLFLFGTNQSQVQRYLCCKTLLEAKKAVYFGLLVSLLVFGLVITVGFITYAYFEDCDPLLGGRISAPDQIVPYFVLRIFTNQPGLPGLFVAGLFAGCLSSVSSGINALACVTVKDFVQPFMKQQSNTVLQWTSKGLVFVYGALCIGFAFLSTTLGGLVQGSLSIIGILGGPLLGVFSLGITFPCANTQGATVGLITGVAMTIWIYIGSTIYPPGVEFTRPKPLSDRACALQNVTHSSTTFVTAVADRRTTDIAITSGGPGVPPETKPALADLYAVSFAYYAAIGYGATLIVGLGISLITCGHRNSRDVDPRLIVPFLDHKLLRWLPRKFRHWMRCGVKHNTTDENEDVITLEKYEVPSGNAGKYKETEVATISGTGLFPNGASQSFNVHGGIPNDGFIDFHSQSDL